MTRLHAGAALLGFMAFIAALSLVWTPDARPLELDIANRLSPPSTAALLGTDQLGRDTASMVMLGARNSLSLAALAVALGAACGLAVGLSCAERRGLAPALAMRAMDILFAFPPILSAMILALLLGPGRAGAVLAIALFTMPVFARLARAEARRILVADFVRAARALGVGEGRILLRHVLPNMAGGTAVQVSVQFGLAILTEAGLSFIGLGIMPPQPSWGRMLADSQTYMSGAPWLALAPGIAIAVTVLGATLMGDGLAERR